MTFKRHAITLSTRALLGVAGLLLPLLAAAQIAPLTYELTGDLGGAVYGTQSVIRSKGSETVLLGLALMQAVLIASAFNVRRVRRTALPATGRLPTAV